MRNKIQHLICIGIIICSVSSCVFAGKDILYGQPKGFVNDYSEKLNNIDQMIKVDGYYQSDILSYGSLSIMLYRDGTIFSIRTSPAYDADSDLILPDNQSWKNRWGSYQICDSNIYVQTIEQIEWYYVTHNYILEIVNDTTLMYKPIIHKNAKNETIKVFDYFTGTAEFHFHPLPDRVDSTKYKKELKERKKQNKI